MLQGTGSDVGKSLLLTGLGRAFKNRGLLVRPFKPQNMSNNAAVTADGGEIGRAQALQALACRVEPTTDMNPVLLKPQSEIGSQVIVNGRIWGNAKAREYYQLRSRLITAVQDSFNRLCQNSDLVLVEGAGSAAEVNLRAGDIANMGFALRLGVPVALVGDVDRGGVLASLVGTKNLLSDPERKLICGYIINRFRGDVSLFDSAISIITRETSWSNLGVVPYFHAAKNLPKEDSMGIIQESDSEQATIQIAVPVISRISNFDDMDPLQAEPDVNVKFIQAGNALPGNADLVILPGSKSTVSDLQFLRDQGWDIDLQAHLRRGGWVLGLCGGYQMLGNRVADPEGVEGEKREIQGLGLLNVETTLTTTKTLLQARGIERETGTEVYGYEMHVGNTAGPDTSRPFLSLPGHDEGAQSLDGKIIGCYLHGLFKADQFRHSFLNRIRQRGNSGVFYDQKVDETLNNLADHLETHLNLDKILELASQRLAFPKKQSILSTRAKSRWQ